MPAPRPKRLLFWSSIFGLLGLLLLPFAMPMYAVMQAKSSLRKAHKVCEKAGLPMDWEEIAPKVVEDKVTPIIREAWQMSSFHQRRKLASSMKAQGKDASGIMQNSYTRLRYDFQKPRRDRMRAGEVAHQTYQWILTEEERERLAEFCRHPRNMMVIHLLKDAASHDTRDPSQVGKHEFANLLGPATSYLEPFQMHAAYAAAQDPSQLDELYTLILTNLKLWDLNAQDLTTRSYEGRAGVMGAAIRRCMYFEREHGTPSWVIDKIANWTSPEQELKRWKKHHDQARLVEWPKHFELENHDWLLDPESMGLNPRVPSATLMGGTGLSTSTTRCTKTPYARILTFKHLPDAARQPFAQAAVKLTYAKNLELLVPTRGVEASHYQAAKKFHMQDFTAIENRWVSRPTPPQRDEDLMSLIESYHMLLMWQEVYGLGQAINRHADQHGQLPATLEDLDPTILKHVPTDRFPIGKKEPLIYKVNGDTFELRSLGRNGVDDEGHFVYEYLKGYSLSGEQFDDIAYTGRRTILPEPTGP